MTQVARDYVSTGPVAEQHVHISWRAVLAGIVVALAVDVLLSLLGFAVGLTAFQPTAGSAKGVGMGIGIWLIITAIASVFAGAYFGARIAGDPWKGDGAAHGVLVWAGFTLISLWLVGSGIGKIMSSAAGLAGSAIGALTTSGATSSAASDTRGSQAQIVGALTDLGYDPDDAERIATEAKRQAPTPPTVTGPEAQQRATQTAKEAADKAAAGGAAASWMGFGIALLSLLGGAFGGMLGAIGEQKQVVRYTRSTVRVEPIEPSRPEPIG